MPMELTTEEMIEHAEAGDNLGICRLCGSVAEGVEPDARNYECHACGRAEVFGLEEYLMEFAQ